MSQNLVGTAPVAPLAPGTLTRTRGVLAPRGFRAAGVAAGIKASGRRDVTVVINDGKTTAAAGVFTTNKVKAAPVLWSQQVLAGGQVRAVALNSGGANACTGAAGFQDTHRSAEHLAAAVTATGTDCGAAQIAVCSTGLIGDRLPLPRLLAGLDAAVADGGDSAAHDLAAAEGIMTTDSVPKRAAISHPAGFTVGGIAKGAGMLAPGLATMLVVLTTDVEASPQELDAALRAGTAVSFDRLDIDGAMSTNDTVLLLASGAAGVRAGAADLADAVTAVCDDLARQLQADAEGVTKIVDVTVVDAASTAEAVVAARIVARDSLVKTALFGSDPNWGRVVAAVGTAPVEMVPESLSVRFNGQLVCENCTGIPAARELDLSGKEIEVEISLGTGGSGRATIRTTDLSHAYVEENSAYSS